MCGKLAEVLYCVTLYAELGLIVQANHTGKKEGIVLLKDDSKKLPRKLLVVIMAVTNTTVVIVPVTTTTVVIVTGTTTTVVLVPVTTTTVVIVAVTTTTCNITTIQVPSG